MQHTQAHANTICKYFIWHPAATNHCSLKLISNSCHQPTEPTNYCTLQLFLISCQNLTLSHQETPLPKNQMDSSWRIIFDYVTASHLLRCSKKVLITKAVMRSVYFSNAFLETNEKPVHNLLLWLINPPFKKAFLTTKGGLFILTVGYIFSMFFLKILSNGKTKQAQEFLNRCTQQLQAANLLWRLQGQIDAVQARCNMATRFW